MPSFLDSVTIAQGLDKIAAKLSVFSISPEPAIMAAQRIRDLAMQLSVAEKQRDEAVSNQTASYFERPAQAPRRAIQGVEIETMSSSESYRVRFGETVPHSDLEGVDASVLFGDLVSEFARQLAVKLGIDAEFDFDVGAGDLTVSGIVSTRSAAMAMSVASYGYDVRPAVPMTPPRVEYDMPTVEYDTDDDPEDDEEPFECTCMSCSEARASEARARVAEEAAAAERMVVTSDTPLLTTRRPWDEVFQSMGWIESSRLRTTAQPYAEPESERAISESDENHWRTRGV